MWWHEIKRLSKKTCGGEWFRCEKIMNQRCSWNLLSFFLPLIKFVTPTKKKSIFFFLLDFSMYSIPYDGLEAFLPLQLSLFTKLLYCSFSQSGCWKQQPICLCIHQILAGLPCEYLSGTFLSFSTEVYSIFCWL